jgi:hypothetical protein
MARISRNLPIKLLHNIKRNISPRWYRQTFTKPLLLFCHLGSVITKWRPHHLSLFYYWSILALENGQRMSCILSCEIRIWLNTLWRYIQLLNDMCRIIYELFLHYLNNNGKIIWEYKRNWEIQRDDRKIIFKLILLKRKIWPGHSWLRIMSICEL